MTGNPFSHTDWLRGLAFKAEEVRQSIAGESSKDAFRVIQSIVENAEVVFGVWPDKAAPDGFDFHLVKGAGRLADIASGRQGKEIAIQMAAIPCDCFEQALAASQKWGVLH